MNMESPRDLFVHELADTMSAEHITLEMLSKLAGEAQHPEARKAFKEHEQETRQQVKNLEQAFKQLGIKPEATTCYAAEGLKKEHEAIHEEQPSPQVLELANVAGAAKTEHYEIASYTALVQMARDLGERDVMGLLQENLDQEKAMAKRVEGAAKAIANEAKAKAKEAERANKDEAKRARVEERARRDG